MIRESSQFRPVDPQLANSRLAIVISEPHSERRALVVGEWLQRLNYDILLASDWSRVQNCVLEQGPSLIVFAGGTRGPINRNLLEKLFDADWSDQIPIMFAPAVDSTNERGFGDLLKLVASRPSTPEDPIAPETDLDENNSILVDGPVRVDALRRQAFVNNASVPLTPTEFELLHTLISARGGVIGRDRPRHRMDRRVISSSRRIDVHITSLRKKLRTAGPCIQTIRGFGYAWRPFEQLPAGRNG